MANSTFAATVTGGPGNQADWVLLYKVGDPVDRAHLIDWKWLATDDQRYPFPNPGVTSGTVLLTLPLDAAGQQYVCYFAANGSYNVALTSPTISGVSQAFPMLGSIASGFNGACSYLYLSQGSTALDFFQPVSGTITIDYDGNFAANGIVLPSGFTVQWMLDNQPFGNPIQGPPIRLAFDTTTVPDGTHFLSFRVLDCSDATWRAYQLQAIGRTLIVQNHGPVNGAQLVPVASAGINIREWIRNGAPAVTCDFVNYPGTPPLGTPRPYPAPVVPPAFSPSSPYHSNPAALRQVANWFTESSITEPVIGEYNDVQHLCTTKTGGVAAFGFYPHTGINFEGAYDSEYRQDMRDGPRQQCSVSPYVTWVPHPDNIGDANDLWVGVEINGRILTMGLDGHVTTIAGNQLNYPAVLPYPPNVSLTEADYMTRKNVVGNIVLPIFGDFTGLNDLCFDPRPDANGKHTLLYACKPNDNVIIAVDLSVSPPRCYRYAGQDGAADGYVEGDPLAAAKFAGPYSIIMADGRNPALPAGTMLVADKRNSAIRKIAPGASHGGAGTVSTLCGGTVGPTPPTEAELAANQAAYDAYGAAAVSFAAAYTPFPQVIRFFSDGNIMLGEDHTTFIREINLSGSGSIRFIAAFYGTSWQPNGNTWFWADVDTVGAIGPVDDVIYTQADGGQASAEVNYRCSRDGTYNDKFVSDEEFPGSGGAGHYPWAQAVSRTQARYLSSGFAQNGVFSLRASNPATDPIWIDYHDLRYGRGSDLYRYGTCFDFPFGSRPSLAELHGIYGQAFIGTKTFSDLMAAYPSATPGDAGDQALAAFIQGGMDGSVPRPEITGNDMADLIYFIRRTSLEGHGPPAVQPLPRIAPSAAPIVSNVAATRSADRKSLTVTWMTNVATIGVAGAGPAGQQTASGYDGNVYSYTVWSPIESGYGTSHSVTITGLLASWTPVHFTVIAKDVVGDFARSNDAVVS